jgi:hypothetical protein
VLYYLCCGVRFPDLHGYRHAGSKQIPEGWWFRYGCPFHSNMGLADMEKDSRNRTRERRRRQAEASLVPFSLSTLKIGTDSLGDVTSWNITGTQFASYPAFAGDPPSNYFCDYGVTFSPSGGSGSLSTDHDAGFCPSSAVGAAAIGSWSAYTPVSTTPEPRNSALIGGGLLGLVALVTRRKRAAIAR